MKRLAVFVSLSLGGLWAAPGMGWEAPYGPPMVVTAHDREPMHESRGQGDKDVTTPDNECNEQHKLQPDGDNDCDDPVRSVPEPGPLGLLVLGLGGLALSRWRRGE